MESMAERKLSRLHYELDWRGKIAKSFKNWFFNFFVTYRSDVSIKNQTAILELLKKDWSDVRDMFKFAYASSPKDSVV